jgi:RNA polymerase sigma-70 factor (ECF subfamily)
VDASSQPGDLLLPISPAEESSEHDSPSPVSQGLLPQAEDLWRAAEADRCGLGLEDFLSALLAVGASLNHGRAAGEYADAAQKTAFFRSLHLKDFALAQACSLGTELAWERFIALYRGPLTQAAIAIAGSATLGHDLADSLYADLYGMRQLEGARRSPLASYSGRGSLLGWLRATLAQRYVDHHRKTRREAPLDAESDASDTLAAPVASLPARGELERLARALSRTLAALPAEDRFLLSAYFLDRQTLLQISRLLRVHEATISRRLKRLTSDLRKQLIHHLQAGGLSRRAAEEALGADPRDIEINLRALLQTSQVASFQDTKTRATADGKAVEEI